MTDPTDDLEPLLSPRPAAATSVDTRDALFRRTTRRLAVARGLRRLASAVALVAIFTMGGVLGWVLKPDSEPVTVFLPTAVLVPGVEPAPRPAPPSNDAVAPVSVEAILSPNQTEMQAELADDANEAARLYRLAGDRYLNDRDDYVNAARCYRLFLQRAGDAGLTLAAEDSWLLASLKNAAFKDKAFAAKG